MPTGRESGPAILWPSRVVFYGFLVLPPLVAGWPLPAARSQTVMTSSAPAVAQRVPSGKIARSWMPPKPVVSRWTSDRLATSKTWMAPVSPPEPETSRLESGVKASCWNGPSSMSRRSRE